VVQNQTILVSQVDAPCGERVQLKPHVLLQLRSCIVEQRRDEVSKYLEADLAEFKKLQEVVETYLNDNQSSKANVM